MCAGAFRGLAGMELSGSPGSSGDSRINDVSIKMRSKRSRMSLIV